MKRLAIFMITVLLMLSACVSKKDPNDYMDYTGNKNESFIYIDSDDEPILDNYLSLGNDIQYYDGYLYFFNGPQSGFLDDFDKDHVTTFMKYNVKTGSITTVCQDPLCSHTTPSCPFAGSISNFYFNNSNVFYIRAYMYYSSKTDSKESLRQFGTYNLETMKYTVHSESEIVNGLSYGEGYKQLYADNYCYFYDYVYDEKYEKYIYKICRIDLRTSKVKVIGGENNIDNASAENNYTVLLPERFLFVLDNRIYFTDIETIYSTDLDINDKQIHVRGNFIYENIYTDGKYICYGVATDTPNVQSLHRVNFDGTGDIELDILTKTWTITKNYIYYDSVYDKTIGGKSPNEGITFYSDTILRCNYDGKNKETVYQADNDPKYTQLVGTYIVGNYIYANYYTYEDKNNNDKIDEGEYYLNSNDINYNFLRINMVDYTIEYVYMK